MAQTHDLHRLRHPRRFAEVQFGRLAGIDRAEPAGARASAAKDHDRRDAPVPAFAQVGTLGALANRVQLVRLHQPHQMIERLPSGNLGPEPRRFTVCR